MTTVLLIRHAECDLIGKALAGRTDGIGLNEKGKRQAAMLARWIVRRGAENAVTAITCSPLERACETARPLAELTGLRWRRSANLNEIDFGEWTGLTFDELRHKPGWDDFNTCRSCSRPPGGEFMVEAQARAVREINSLCNEFPQGVVAVISHADVIRAAVAHYVGIPLDLMQRFEISPASVSIIEFHERGPRLVRLNWTVPPDTPLGQNGL